MALAEQAATSQEETIALLADLYHHILFYNRVITFPYPISRDGSPHPVTQSPYFDRMDALELKELVLIGKGDYKPGQFMFDYLGASNGGFRFRGLLSDEVQNTLDELSSSCPYDRTLETEIGEDSIVFSSQPDNVALEMNEKFAHLSSLFLRLYSRRVLDTGYAYHIIGTEVQKEGEDSYMVLGAHITDSEGSTYTGYSQKIGPIQSSNIRDLFYGLLETIYQLDTTQEPRNFNLALQRVIEDAASNLRLRYMFQQESVIPSRGLVAFIATLLHLQRRP